MSTSTKNRYINRRLMGELNINSGALGQYTNVGAVSSLTLNPASLFDGYVGTTTAGVTVAMPTIAIINNAIVGWKTTFFIGSTSTSFTTSFVTSLSGTITNTLEQLVSTLGIMETLLVVAVAASNTWIFMYTFPSFYATATPIQGLSSFYRSNNNPANYYANRYAKARFAPNSAVNVNVLFATPVVLAFSATVTNVDGLFYTYISPYTSFPILVTGVYLIECSFGVANTGGGTSTNIQIAARRNGVTVPGTMATTSSTTFGTTILYTLKAMIQFTANDTLSFIGGKSVISLGTSGLTGVVYIKYIG